MLKDASNMANYASKVLNHASTGVWLRAVPQSLLPTLSNTHIDYIYFSNKPEGLGYLDQMQLIKVKIKLHRALQELSLTPLC